MKFKLQCFSFQCTTVITDTLIPNIVHVISWAKNFFSYETWCKVKKLRYKLETTNQANIYLKGDGDYFLIWSFSHWHTKLANKMFCLSIDGLKLYGRIKTTLFYVQMRKFILITECVFTVKTLYFYKYLEKIIAELVIFSYKV